MVISPDAGPRPPRTLIAAALSAGCSGAPWNNPYPASEAGANILYSSFSERPKHLDPVQSYSSNEITFTAQIYEPPLQYHYFKRPYKLIPLAAPKVPRAAFYDAKGRRLPGTARREGRRLQRSTRSASSAASSTSRIRRSRADARRASCVYHDLTRARSRGQYTLGDFKQTGTRELIARDYVYQIKRLAHPRLHSPIMQLMGDYIVGLKDYAEVLKRASQELAAERARTPGSISTSYPLAGVEVVDDYTYRIRVQGQYPQFLYWLAMPFFAPVPLEADRFFAQPGMAEKNI